MTLLAELSQSTIILLVVAGAALLFLMYGVGIYNGLVTLRNRFKNAFAQIDVQLKRRYDLIPNLVEVAKGYMKHERETLEAVIAARNQAASAGQKAAASPGDPAAMQSLNVAEGQLQGTLGRLFALAESYPDLKANQNMLQLQEELTSTENKVAFSRQAYNDAVMAYNTKRETFPDLIIANFTGFTEAKLFEVEQPAEREAPKVKF
jgi:LemA protein